MKNNIGIVLAVIAVIGIGFLYYYLVNVPNQEENLPPLEQFHQETQNIESSLPPEAVPENGTGETQTQTAEEQAEAENKDQTIIGKSVNGRDIVAYHFGAGTKEVLFVGGIHGGYAWNTSLLAYQLIDRLKTNADGIPASVKITVIPVLNPDGLAKVVDKSGPFAIADVSTSADTAAARFNGNNVDLNRNFDCEWQASGVWQNRTVSGGTAPFSEPESAALRVYVQNRQPAAVVAWYAAAGGVFASSCKNGVSVQTQAIMNAYAKDSGYPAHQDFDFYEITGDMTNWFAKIGVPAIGVVLSSRDNSEWSKNQAGSLAVIEYVSKQ